MSTEAGWVHTSGQTLAGRYLLQTPLDQPESGTEDDARCWRGVDTVLNRAVSVHLRAGARSAVLDAAIAAGQVRHPNLVSIYDAASTEDCCYVVTEWVEGDNLTAMLRDGPLEPDLAAEYVRQAAEAVATLHSHGIAHGDLSTDTVRITPDGHLKLSVPIAGSVPAADADLHALGTLLYATLTGHAPFDNGSEVLPVAPPENGRLRAPRQVRAGVPYALSTTAMRALGADGTTPPTADGLALELARHSDAPTEATPALTGFTDTWDDYDRRAPQTLSGWRKVAMWIAVALLVVAIGFVIGVWRGAIPAPRQLGARSSTPTTSPSPTPSTAGTAAIPIQNATLLDPSANSDHTEGRGLAAAYDSDPRSSWDTDSYTSASYGRLKQGMGISADLGGVHDISSVTVTLRDPGATVALLRSDAPAQDPSGFRTVRTVSGAGTTVTFRPDASARYWAIWITTLPRVGGGYQARVADLRFTGR